MKYENLRNGFQKLYETLTSPVLSMFKKSGELENKLEESNLNRINLEDLNSYEIDKKEIKPFKPFWTNEDETNLELKGARKTNSKVVKYENDNGRKKIKIDYSGLSLGNKMPFLPFDKK